MPVKKGLKDTGDYSLCKDLVNGLNVGESEIVTVDHLKRCQKYLYEIGLRAKPRRSFSTKTIDDNTLQVWRLE